MSSLAPKDAVAFLSLLARSDGIQVSTWALADGSRAQTLAYYPYDRKVEGMPAGPTLLQQTWEKLDEYVSIIMDQTINAIPEKEEAKLKARGIAEVLALFMPPFFHTSDEVVREAIKRHKARLAGDNYETPGLGSRMYEPPPGEPSKYSKREEAKVVTTKKTGKRIPDAAVAASKAAIEAKSFTVAQVAKVYGMTDAEVKEQLGLP